jgi:hypothetical protein
MPLSQSPTAVQHTLPLSVLFCQTSGVKFWPYSGSSRYAHAVLNLIPLFRRE